MARLLLLHDIKVTCEGVDAILPYQETQEPNWSFCTRTVHEWNVKCQVVHVPRLKHYE